MMLSLKLGIYNCELVERGRLSIPRISGGRAVEFMHRQLRAQAALPEKSLCHKKAQKSASRFF